jgi:hypothetical protein
MNTMMNAAAELYLGTSHETAMALGPRQFRTAANAVRFAMEQAAPVSLRGALLRIGTLTLGPVQIAKLYRALPAQTVPATVALTNMRWRPGYP